MGDASLPDITNMTADEFAATLLPQLTLEEKVKLLAGADMWRTNAIPRVGISQMKCSDGPVGVRGGQFTDGVTAASLPSGVSLASTWDTKMIDVISTILIPECRSKGIDVLLGPTVCIPRTPLGGRNFESYSEDPFLSGKLAASYIRNIQSAGIATCIKHFAANDQEHRRFFVDARISERALREIHTMPFEIAVREANPWSLMTAYNRVNGEYCSANRYLLRDVLREEWGWDGVAMSDWFGTNTVVPSVEVGLDLEMPGPVKRRGKHLIEAHKQGLISEERINECAIRMLKLLHRTGKSKDPAWVEPPEQAVDLPEHREIMRRCAAEGIVLLKNDNILPLHLRPGMRIAVIGPNAGKAVQSGGGSSDLAPHYRTIPYDSIKRAISESFGPEEIQVSHAQGVLSHRYIPLMAPSAMRNPITGKSGWTLSFWDNMSHSGDPIQTEHRSSSILVCYDTLPETLQNGLARYSYRGTTILTPTKSGKHWFSLSSCGPGKLLLDGEVILHIPRRWWSPKSPLFMSYGSPEERVQVYLEGGREYELTLESISREPEPYEFSYTGDLLREEIQDGGRVGFLEEDDRDLMGEAVDLARESDLVIMVVGKDREWESETSDMVSMDLPAGQDDLVQAVLGVNKNVVVVNQTGSPIAMPWLDGVRGVVQAWYQGQEHANALVDVLFGKVNPCGKLPITFPKTYEQNPSYLDYPGSNDRVVYGEGIFAGYRWYDRLCIEPLFPFGFGKSYSEFRYSDIRVSGDNLAFASDGTGSIEVSVDVTNISHVAGKEIVQFYVEPVTAPRMVRPKRELKGWDKVFVEPGQTVQARAELDWVSVSYWDDERHGWVVDGGATFAVVAAKHSRDEGVTATFTVEKPSEDFKAGRFTVVAGSKRECPIA